MARTPAPAGADATLAEALVGKWALRSYATYDDAGHVETPLGRRARGMLLYTPDGHVSVHVMADDRPRCGALLPYDCTRDEKRALAESYFGYAGTYRVEGDRVTHRVAVASYPNWTGTDLHRTVELQHDVLTLRSAPQTAGGRSRVAVLTWSRDR